MLFFLKKVWSACLSVLFIMDSYVTYILIKSNTIDEFPHQRNSSVIQ